MTEKQPNQQPYPQNYPPYYEEDEINLIDLLRVIWKWKWLIAVGTLICVVVAIVFSYLLPKVYQVDMMVEPGIIDIRDNGAFIFLDLPENISRKINEQAYNQRIIASLNIDPKEARLDLKADTNGKGKSQIIKVTSEWEENKINLGVKALHCLIDLLTDDYRPIVQQKQFTYDSKITTNKNKIHDIEIQKKDLEQQIQTKMSDIKNKKNQMQIKQARLEGVGQQIEKLLLELKQVKENSEKIAEKRQSLINEGNRQDDMSLMLYGTTLQQNILYFNELNTHIYNLTREQNTVESQINSLESDLNTTLGEIERLRLRKVEGVQIIIDDTNAEIERLQSEKQIITNIKIIKTPEVSADPIKPKKKKIVALTGFASLFIFVFLAFFIEYIRNASKE